jgi:hypothetical protein
MGDLFQVLSESIYHVYQNSKGMMNFDSFVNFSKDHDIFPSYCSKATLYRIFHSLSSYSGSVNTPLQGK